MARETSPPPSSQAHTVTGSLQEPGSRSALGKNRTKPLKIQTEGERTLCVRVVLLPAAGGSRKLAQLQRVSVLPLGQAVPAQLTPQPSQNAQNPPPALFPGAQRHCCARTGLYRNLLLLKDFAQLLSLDWEQLGVKQGGRQPAARSSSTCSTKGPSSYLDAVSTGARVSAS